MQCKGCGATDFVTSALASHTEHKCKYCGRKEIEKKPQKDFHHGGIHISGGSLSVGGDFVGGSKTVVYRDGKRVVIVD